MLVLQCICVYLVSCPLVCTSVGLRYGAVGIAASQSITDPVKRVAVNSTHGQLDTFVELTHLQKSQLDTSQRDTGVNSTHGQLDTTRHKRQLTSIYSAILLLSIRPMLTPKS